MNRIQTMAALAAASLAIAGSAHADLNNPPPAGPLVLDLAGKPLPTVYTEYTTSFTAVSTSSTVTFVLRHDPGWFALDNVSVSTGGGANLLSDPGFEDPGLGGWDYFAQSGVSHTGFVGGVGSTVGGIPWTAPVLDGAHDWLDGSTGGYDGLSQTLTTIVGQTYDISFWLDQRLTQNVVATNFQQLSNNGQSGVLGNGIDMLVYAGNGQPSTTLPLLPGVPEPGTWALMILGFGAVGGLGRLRRSRLLQTA